MNMNINKLVSLLFLVIVSCSIHTWGLKCYQCSDDYGHKCNDKFNANGYGVVEVDSTSGYCWKMKVEHTSISGAIRGGDRLQDQHPDLYCPGVNTCREVNGRGGKVFLCCCQDKDFCNTATTNAVTLWILLPITAFIYIFVHMY